MREKEIESAGNVYEIGGVPYRALEEPDLNWLRPYGAVFQVFDQQNSGNLCFGVDGRFGRLFIKFYYWISPGLAKRIRQDSLVGKWIRSYLDKKVERLSM